MAYIRSSLADGSQAVYDEVIRALSKLKPEAKLRLLESAVDIVGRRALENTPLKLGYYMEIRALVSDVLEGNQKLVHQFLGQFTDCELKNLYFH